MEKNSLTHWGVKGMRWGVRRSKAQLARARGSSKKASEDIHEDYKKAHSQKSVKSMSDAELRARNNRLNMERQYKQLTAKQASAGKKFVTGVVVGAATPIATAYASKYMKKGIAYGAKHAKKGVAHVVRTAKVVKVAKKLPKG
jgi:hypothetical protein